MRFLLVIFFLLISYCVDAQSINEYKQTQDQIHTIYLYNFSRYFVWPDTNYDEFLIGVMGEHDVYDEIRKMADSKTVGGKPIKVKAYENPKDIDQHCHIIFIPYENSYWLSEVLSITQNHPILVVSSKPGMGKFGSLLNFVAHQGKITFEINEEAIRNRQLKFAQQIKAIGRIL
ncbi:hypothetical protein OKW21_003293 [Catalinimonas alkaloidigena]|uniref:YfiR family protein n=1 Tax=Catalinimonas alkaloidigena TaxID=1075417 RepID=UPI0024061EBC|nr:YfiR family protein [Catalinimonas alkaloidigena]MDF9798030.1 hypothetical protein [Catalinimonas alkaloidigena]